MEGVPKSTCYLKYDQKNAFLIGHSKEFLEDGQVNEIKDAGKWMSTVVYNVNPFQCIFCTS